MATTDPNSAIGQSNTGYNTFSQFYSDLEAFLLGNSTTCPEFSDYVSNLDYSELHRVALTSQIGSANYPGGAAVENVHHMAAANREYGIRQKSKADYYADGQTDSGNESDYYSAMMTYYGNMLQGVYAAGSTS
jgi:hypothetical protein